MPYISYDENPYLVVDENGKLLWVLDGYTTSDYYPFSQKITLNDESVLNKEQINYIRNSVKVLIDAYDGTIKFYITDRNDPIIMAYQKMYKDLFVDKDEAIPENISEQFIYPEYLYKIQAEVIKDITIFKQMYYIVEMTFGTLQHIIQLKLQTKLEWN